MEDILQNKNGGKKEWTKPEIIDLDAKDTEGGVPGGTEFFTLFSS